MKSAFSSIIDPVSCYLSDIGDRFSIGFMKYYARTQTNIITFTLLREHCYTKISESKVEIYQVLLITAEEHHLFENMSGNYE